MIKGDKIKLVNKMGAFTNIGEVCEVVDVTQEGVISFKFGNGMHLGCMSYDEFKKHFELVERKEEKKREWGDWCKYFISVECHNIKGSIPAEVRTNRRIVQVRYKLPDDTYIRAQSSCYKDDKFLFYKGRCLAEKRLLAKMFANEAKYYAAVL